MIKVIPHKFKLVASKIFFGFLAMTLMLVALGGYAFHSIESASEVVEETYDKPLMAINFARSASQKFSELEILKLNALNDESTDTAFEEISSNFLSDLKIAKERSIAQKADTFFEAVETDFRKWKAHEQKAIFLGQTERKRTVEAKKIGDNLEIIVELQTNQSFRNREYAIQTMQRINKLSFLAFFIGLLLTVALTLWIGISTLRPLRAAAKVAAEISSGRLDTNIPRGGEDEIGQLLRSMQIMQENIKERISNEIFLKNLAQDRLADSLENSKDAILLTDSDGIITVANPGVRDLFGQFSQMSPKVTFVGQSLHSFFKNDGTPQNSELEKGNFENEFLVDNEKWIRVNASETREGGRLFIWSNISESYRTAERLKRAFHLADSASRAKTNFLAAMSHELNTPLNAIVGLSDALRLDLLSKSLPESAALSKQITFSGEHMAQIVRDVLEIANDEIDIDTANQSMGFESIRISKLALSVIQDLRPLAKQRNVTIYWKCPAGIPRVSGVKDDIEILIRKLVDNAIKFNKPGGFVKVTLRNKNEDSICLDIVDNGIGIALEDQKKIMEPFVQLHEGYSRKVDGTGLGLAIVQRIITRLGANLEVRSFPGKGSIFRITFPRNAQKHPSMNDQKHPSMNDRYIEQQMKATA